MFHPPHHATWVWSLPAFPSSPAARGPRRRRRCWCASWPRRTRSGLEAGPTGSTRSSICLDRCYMRLKGKKAEGELKGVGSNLVNSYYTFLSLFSAFLRLGDFPKLGLSRRFGFESRQILGYHFMISLTSSFLGYVRPLEASHLYLVHEIEAQQIKTFLSPLNQDQG